MFIKRSIVIMTSTCIYFIRSPINESKKTFASIITTTTYWALSETSSAILPINAVSYSFSLGIEYNNCVLAAHTFCPSTEVNMLILFRVTTTWSLILCCEILIGSTKLNCTDMLLFVILVTLNV